MTNYYYDNGKLDCSSENPKFKALLNYLLKISKEALEELEGTNKDPNEIGVLLGNTFREFIFKWENQLLDYSHRNTSGEYWEGFEKIYLQIYHVWQKAEQVKENLDEKESSCAWTKEGLEKDIKTLRDRTIELKNKIES